MYLSDKTSEAIDVLVGMAFDLNRTFDRMVSVMTNKWCMPQASDIIHHKLAHLWSLMADELTSFKDNYNLSSVYPETHRDGRDYNNLSDMMGTMLEETGDFYKAIKMTYGIAKEEGDLNACAMLIHFTEQMTALIGQIITLRDKAEQMPDRYDEYDRHITSWGIDGIDLQ